MNSYPTYLFTGLPFVATATLIAYCLWPKRDNQNEEVDLPVEVGERINERELAFIENHLVGLQDVIVAADRVEAPTNSLRQAVEHNFARGVRYLFLISQDKAEAERHSYFLIFEAIAKVVRKRTGSTKPIEDFVDIQKLLIPWPTHPYVFYKFKDATGETGTIAFQGHGIREGIADAYTRIDSEIAHTIYHSILSGAPEPIREAVALKFTTLDDAERVLDSA